MYQEKFQIKHQYINKIKIIDNDGEYIDEIKNKYYKILKLKNRDSIMIKESEIKSIKKEHHIVIPPANHPWRKNMMLR